MEKFIKTDEEKKHYNRVFISSACALLYAQKGHFESVDKLPPIIKDAFDEVVRSIRVLNEFDRIVSQAESKPTHSLIQARRYLRVAESIVTHNLIEVTRYNLR